MTVSDDQDEILAHFLGSVVLSADQEEEDESKTKRLRIEENDNLESQWNSGKLNMNPDSVQPNNNSNNKKSVPRSIETGILSKIPPELFTHILNFLSSEQDEEYLIELVRNCPPEFKEHYIQTARSKTEPGTSSFPGNVVFTIA